jgi:hypothetical protein
MRACAKCCLTWDAAVSVDIDGDVDLSATLVVVGGCGEVVDVSDKGGDHVHVAVKVQVIDQRRVKAARA